MTRIANPFRYMLREAYQPAGSGAVYKAWFGKKYLVWKGKSLQQSVNMISVELDRRLRLGSTGPDDQFVKVCPYIRKARVGMMEIEAVLLSDNPVELLICEYNELKKASTDPNCLNIAFFPHVPKWIPETAHNEFRSYIAKLAAKKKAPAKKDVKSKKRVNAKQKPRILKSKKKGAVVKK